MFEIRKIYAKQQVEDSLNTKNGFQVDSVHNLLINSDILVFCNGNASCIGRWTSKFKPLGIINKTCKISLLSRYINFRRTVVKFYLIRPENNDQNTSQPIIWASMSRRKVGQQYFGATNSPVFLISKWPTSGLSWWLLISSVLIISETQSRPSQYNTLSTSSQSSFRPYFLIFRAFWSSVCSFDSCSLQILILAC